MGTTYYTLVSMRATAQQYSALVSSPNYAAPAMLLLLLLQLLLLLLQLLLLLLQLLLLLLLPPHTHRPRACTGGLRVMAAARRCG